MLAMASIIGRGVASEWETRVTVLESHQTLDRKKLYELASHPGTFPEMIQSTYHAGFEVGKGEGMKQTEEAETKLRRSRRQIAWVAAFLSAIWLACLLFYCLGMHTWDTAGAASYTMGDNELTVVLWREAALAPD